MAAVLATGAVRAQVRQVRVGILHPLPRGPNAVTAMAILERMAELGYREGAAMKVEYRTGGDDYPKAAKELIDAKCDVFFAIGPEAAVKALQVARAPAPIVFYAIDYDPVAKGIVSSLGRPDRNSTGIFVPQNALVAKRFELLRELLPDARNFLVLSDVHSRDQVAPARAAAEASGVRMTLIEFLNPPYDFAAAFATARKERADGMVVLNSPVFFARGKELAALQLEHRLPAVGGRLPWVEAGFVSGLAEDSVKATRRAAQMALRIIKGAKPADIPVEQADEFELAINAKTAKALGVKVPESVLARATKIVQ